MLSPEMRPLPSTPAEMTAARNRSVRTLVAGVALGSTGHIAAVTVATIVAEDIAGTSAFAGAPGATVVAGAALGSAVLSWLMTRRGRRVGLTTGYLVGVLGALIATLAVVLRDMPILLLGTMLIGFGNSSNHLSRYTAADLFAPERRASAIGVVVWAATVGAVIGPNLVPFAGSVSESIGLPTLAGPYLLPVLFVGLAALLSFALLRPDPYELAHTSSVITRDSPAAESLVTILRRPVVLASIVALIAGQFVMVMVMTMTPLHMVHHGHGLAMVGLVLSAHTFGMYALSPISGRLTDRFGSVKVIYAGLAILATSALLSAVAPPEGGAILLFALFLLGFGWNLGFVAGSAMLTGGISLTERTRIQGIADALVWSSAATASLTSGIVVAAASYTALGLLAAAAVLVPILVLTSRRRGLRAAPPA
jgi:MFS family permease